jgi:hypothetical protein
MAGKIIGPRKQRTRQHVIADLSVHHVQGYVLEEGHTAQKLDSDYGYDLALATYDPDGYIEPDVSFLQLKGAETWPGSEAGYPFDLDIRDYNLWIEERVPVFLVLYDATLRQAYWLHIQGYFLEDTARQPRRGAKTVRVYVPAPNLVNRQAVATWRELKWESRRLALGGTE